MPYWIQKRVSHSGITSIFPEDKQCNTEKKKGETYKKILVSTSLMSRMEEKQSKGIIINYFIYLSIFSLLPAKW